MPRIYYVEDDGPEDFPDAPRGYVRHRSWSRNRRPGPTGPRNRPRIVFVNNRSNSGNHRGGSYYNNNRNRSGSQGHRSNNQWQQVAYGRPRQRSSSNRSASGQGRKPWRKNYNNNNNIQTNNNYNSHNNNRQTNNNHNNNYKRNNYNQNNNRQNNYNQNNNRRQNSNNNNNRPNWSGNNRSNNRFNNQNNNNNNRPKYARSTNPDFSSIVKLCHNIWAAEEQLKNWENLPRGITRAFSDLGESINPVEPTEQFRTHVTDILKNSMCNIQRAVKNHLLKNLEHNYFEITICNPLDRDRVIQVVRAQIKRKGKRKNNNVEDALNKLLQMIGRNYQPPRQTTNLEQPAQRITAPEHVMTPETIRTLVEMEEAAAPPANRSPGGTLLYSEAVRTGHKRRRSGETPPQAAQQTVRIVTPTTITIPRESATIRRRIGFKKIHDRHSKLFWQTAPHPETTHLVISDSNFRNIPDEMIPEGYQVDVFPGMRLSHAASVLNQLPETPLLKNIILSVGVNNRSSPYIEEANNLEEVIRSRQEQIFTVGVPINNKWPQAEQDTIGKINAHLETKNAGSINISTSRMGINFKDDNVHHTDESVERLWTKVRNTITYLSETSIIADSPSSSPAQPLGLQSRQQKN